MPSSNSQQVVDPAPFHRSQRLLLGREWGDVVGFTCFKRSRNVKSRN
jgi:hypothetical protein